MGKASKWFRGLLGLKSPSPTAGSGLKPPKEKRRWSFVKSYREKEKDDQNHHATATATATATKAENRHHATPSHGDLPVNSSGQVEGADPEKQAIVVAAATAAVAEAAVAAAHAAATVVRLTSGGRCGAPSVENGGITRQEWAAVKIQAAFRGCLARKALRALKGLVKLQALVRGHIERKRTAEWLQRMQALLRAQARVRAGRAQILHNSYWSAKSSAAHLHGPATPDKLESPIRSESMKYDQSSLLKRNCFKSHCQINDNGNQEKCGNRSDSRVDEQSRNQRRSWIRTRSMDDERSVRILEIDSIKPNITSKCRNLFYSAGHALLSDHYSHSLSTTRDSTVSYQSGHQSPSSCEVQSYNPLKTNEVEESPICTSDNSPRLLSSSSKNGGSKGSPFTPKRSDGSRSGYCDYPSYMAYTESSKAKVRSLSAPKQRPQQYERCSSSTNYNRYSVHGFGESRLGTHRVSTALQASFTSKAYPGSGRLDKLGMPAGAGYGY